MKKILLLNIIILLFVSCDSKSYEKILVDSSGRMNHILVVINNDDWQGKVGDAIRNTLAKEVIGLPQPEPTLHLNQISPKGFSSFLTSNRNIFFVAYAKENSFTIKNNVYAKPQKIIHIKAKNKEGLITLIKSNTTKIINTIKNIDLKVYQQKNLKKYWNPEKITLFNTLNIKMKIPQTYGNSQDTKEYLWFVKDIPDGYQNILIYSVPITSKADENGENIITTRDLKGHYIPGAKLEKGMYMVTEKAYTPHRFNTQINGKKAYETRGKWMMKGDYMAGPFLNYTVVDKKNNRLIIVEGFTYAPNIKKRNYMFELEAILKTLEIE
ncbi:MAG: DUF4837 family protein [Flavobacteriaceae bacterium]|nr:DUF4837 family protein [Flavobacteriaceae bacterium]